MALKFWKITKRGSSMGWSIEKKKNGKFRFWCSITDSWLTKSLTRNQTIQFFNNHHMHQAKLKVIEEWFAFPHRWNNTEKPHLSWMRFIGL
jgi:hypothetical protein